MNVGRRQTLELLTGIWENKIQADFSRGILINESTLQAALYHHLRCAAPSLMVVTCVTAFGCRWGPSQQVPDMVICDQSAGDVVAVVECKFDKYVRYKDDVTRLADWAKKVHGQSAQDQPVTDSFEIVPESLEWPQSQHPSYHRYKFTSNTLWVFAAIALHDAVGVDVRNVREAAGKCDAGVLETMHLLYGKTTQDDRIRDPEFGSLCLHP